MKNRDFENIISIIVGVGMMVVFFVLTIIFGVLLRLSVEDSQTFNEALITMERIRHQLGMKIATIFIIVDLIIVITIIIYWLYIYKKNKRQGKNLTDSHLQ